MRFQIRGRALTVVALLILATAAHAGDWPQILGPNRDGHAAADEKIADRFPADGPRIVWKKKIGHGFAGPVVAGGKLVLFHRVGEQEVVDCLDAATGESVWSFGYATDYRDDFGFDDGPRAVPTIHDGRVYTHGASGVIHCIDMAEGKPLWSADTVERFGSDKGFFGRACSVLVEGDSVILQVGGENGAGIVALHKETGETRWKSTEDEAGYSSPIAAKLGGKRAVVALTRNGLVVLDPTDGEVTHAQKFRSSQNTSVHGATPLVVGDDGVFLTSSYNVGGSLFRLTPGGVRQVWGNDESLSSQYATPVLRDGLLYGLHGRADVPPKPMLRCVEAATGKVRWSTGPLGAGAVIHADGKLIVLTEEGELILTPATPEGFKPTARGQILGSQTRALPALSNGLLYARDPRMLVCVELR